MSDATYLYAIVKSARPPSVAGAPAGVPGASAPAIHPASASLWLVTAGVPLDRYGPGPLEKSLGNLDWVGQVALAHEQVVEHFARRRGVTLIPMKLFTLFSTPDRAVAGIVRQRRTIDRLMKHVAGAEEWGIRVVRSGDSPSPSRSRTRAATGTAFLAARKQARDARITAHQETAAVVSAALAELSEIARDTVRREHTTPAPATPPLLDAAFLVAARDRRKFDAAARRHALACAGASAELTLTGPWPPYNFVSLES